ncbi:MAG: hypothetical protein WA138_13560 [Parvibaculum sp.]
MRKMILAASAGAISFMIALSPAFALTSYQINTDNNANFRDLDSASPTSGLTITSNSEDGLGNTPTTNNFNSTSQQEDLSRDMSWQGTGYYLRPNR